MTRSEPRGLFISFEGGDGSGKTTQMRLLVERLRGLGRDVIESAEPGGTPIGKQIRRILLDSANRELSARAELLLYFACRAQNADEWIRPALAEGKIVVSDRFTDSTMAYQGIGRQLGTDIVEQLHQIACQELNPDITFYLDIDYRTGLARAKARHTQVSASGGPDEMRLEAEAGEFHQRVRNAYLELSGRYPKRIRRIGAAGSIDDVAAQIWKEVEGHV